MLQLHFCYSSFNHKGSQLKWPWTEPRMFLYRKCDSIACLLKKSVFCHISLLFYWTSQKVYCHLKWQLKASHRKWPGKWPAQSMTTHHLGRDQEMGFVRKLHWRTAGIKESGRDFKWLSPTHLKCWKAHMPLSRRCSQDPFFFLSKYVGILLNRIEINMDI